MTWDTFVGIAIGICVCAIIVLVWLLRMLTIDAMRAERLLARHRQVLDAILMDDEIRPLLGPVLQRATERLNEDMKDE